MGSSLGRSTRKGGGFYGYRVHAPVCSRTDLPVGGQVATAGSHESNYSGRADEPPYGLIEDETG